jgi:hypothetical protein
VSELLPFNQIGFTPAQSFLALFDFPGFFARTIQEAAREDPDKEECDQSNDLARIIDPEDADRWKQPTEPQSCEQGEEDRVTETPGGRDNQHGKQKGERRAQGAIVQGYCV